MTAPPLPLTERHRPRSLAGLLGQGAAASQLASFLAAPYACGMVLHGPTGTGKTSAARVVASLLGCVPEEGEAGGLWEVPSGRQDGAAVRHLLDSLRVRPLMGSGWRVAVVNEADRMTEAAEAIWLDGLESLPAACVVCFTTNDAGALSGRLLGRCEAVRFAGSRAELAGALDLLVRRVWAEETGGVLGILPEGLGVTDAARDEVSFRLALQQIAPYVRARAPLPGRFVPPLGGAEAVAKGVGKRKAKRKG